MAAGLAILLVVLVASIGYSLGLTRGLGQAQAAAATAQAQLARLQAITPTQTATATNTRAPTATPTLTPTPTATPATPAEWAERYFFTTLEGLNTLAMLDFSPARAAALTAGLAHAAGMSFVPISYYELASEPWAAFVSPRTPDGVALPMLFWRDATMGNQIQGQLLLDAAGALAGASGGTAPLAAGLSQGIMQTDNQGNNHVLMVERPEARGALTAYLWSQLQPGSPFTLTWQSSADPNWFFPAAESTVTFADGDRLLPTIVVRSPLPAGSPLRGQLNAPNVFVEQPPFAQQVLETRWQPALASDTDAGAPAQLVGYRLENASLLATPLTALASLLAALQAGDANRAATFAVRIDLLNEMARIGATGPGDWLAVYVNDQDREIHDGSTSQRLWFFDNTDRNRTFAATFTQDPATGLFKVAAVAPVVLASSAGLVTPAPARPTPTPTFTPATDAADVISQSVGLSDAFTLTIPVTTTFGNDDGQNLNPTLEPTGTPTASFTPTPTDTPSPTPTPTDTPLPTETPTPTPPPTETPTPTPTEKPLPIPAIPPDAAAPASGYMLLTETGRLRGGPTTEYLVIAGLENGTLVEVFGSTEAGDWLLIRAATVDDGRTGVLGWVASQLVIPYTDYSAVPRYRADGTPVDAPPTEPAPAPESLPAAPATATPLVTPVIGPPVVQALPAASVPAPETDEIVATIGGEAIPPDPFRPITVTVADGRTLPMFAQTATVEVWGGVFTAPDAGWVTAAAALLWPGAQVYVQGTDTGDRLEASRIRIVGAPAVERTSVLDVPEVATAVGSGSAVALLGSSTAPGIFLLDGTGQAQQIWQYENEAAWISGDPDAGFALHEPVAAGGLHSFSWVRNDGAGLQVYAQPFHRIQGVAGDAYGGIWWIEAPQAELDQWQLWHYDPAQATVTLRMQATSELWASGGSAARGATTTPWLTAIQLATPGDPSTATLFVDTQDARGQQSYTGFYRLTVQTDGSGAATVTEGPVLLLDEGQYRGPLAVSPDFSRLAYFTYDPTVPSLTAGAVRPANTLNVLTLAGRGASIVRPVYSAETRFEFLAPDVAWQGNDRLLTARSRFAADSTARFDRFGIVQLQLPPSGSAPGDPVTPTAYLLPRQQTLLDFVSCLDGQTALLLLRDQDNAQSLARWDGQKQIFPLFALPEAFDRAFLCWRPGP